MKPQNNSYIKKPSKQRQKFGSWDLRLAQNLPLSKPTSTRHRYSYPSSAATGEPKRLRGENTKISPRQADRRCPTRLQKSLACHYSPNSSSCCKDKNLHQRPQRSGAPAASGGATVKSPGRGRTAKSGLFSSGKLQSNFRFFGDPFR